MNNKLNTKRGVGRTADQVDPKKLPKQKPSIFDGAEACLYVVSNRKDSGILARCTQPEHPGLDVVSASSKRFEQTIKGKDVVVMVPSADPGRQRALELLDRCRGLAARVGKFVVHDLGSDAIPDLAALQKEWGEGIVAKQFALEQPWLFRVDLPEPSVNGDGRELFLPLEGGGKKVNYAVLTAAELNFKNASTIKMKPIDWLWKHRFPRGTMSLIAGEGGLGKSQVTLWIAAAISRGWEWPDKSGRAPVGRVLIVTAEDDPDKTIVPRLSALGADIDKIEITTSPKVIIRKGEKELYVDLQMIKDKDYWERLLDLFPDTKALIIDPVVSYLGRGVSDQKNDDVRSVLEPFIEQIIRPRKIAFIAITHLNKSLEAKSVKHRINASIAFVNIPRNVHAILKEGDGSPARIFGQVKCNNAPDTLQQIRFVIEGREVASEEGAIETSVPVFDPELVSLDMNRVMTGEKVGKGPVAVESAKFATWLFEQLKDAPVRLVDLISDAREAGLMVSPTSACPKPSPSPLYNAKRRLPKVHPGWDVEEFQIEKLKAWQLVPVGGSSAPGEAPPF